MADFTVAMIKAAAPTADLIRRLNARAARKGQQRAELIARTQTQTRANWHSSRALWPDLELD